MLGVLDDLPVQAAQPVGRFYPQFPVKQVGHIIVVGHRALLIPQCDLRQNQRFVERFLKLVDDDGLLGDIHDFLMTADVGQKTGGLGHAFDIQAVVIGGKRDDPFLKSGFRQKVPFIIGKSFHI